MDINCKLAGFYGICQTDLCIYLASTLQNMGYRVAVIDNSYEGAMEYCIPHPDSMKAPYNYRDIDYFRLADPDILPRDKYDFILVDLGVWPDRQTLGKFNTLFLVLDPSVSILYKYREYMKENALPTKVLLRGFSHDMVPGKKIEHILEEANPFMESFEILHVFEEDEVLRVSMQYFGFRDFNNISRELEHIITGFAMELCETDGPAVFRGLKRAKRGKCL